MSFDLAYLVTAKVTPPVATGGVPQTVQTIVFRPLGGKQVLAQRFRNDGDSRSSGWTLAVADIAGMDPAYRADFGGVMGVDFAKIVGTSNEMEKPTAKRLEFFHYGTPKNSLRERTGTPTVEVIYEGYAALSHTEIASIHADHKIQGTASQRISKCEAISPINGATLASQVSGQRVANWLSNDAAFNSSRWAPGVYDSLPRGEYVFAQYAGKAAGTPAGEKVAAEKRTFDKTYTRPNGDLYYGRQIGEHEDVEVMATARKHNENVLLFGPPGTGKTALAEAAYMNKDTGDDGLVTILGTAETEVADFIGGYTQRPGEGFVWVDGPLVEAMEAGKVLLVDEIGLIDPKVLSVLYSVMDGRGEYKVTQNPDRGVVKAKEGFYVIAATNPHAPGVQLSEALISRFTIQVEVDSDYELARHLKVNKAVVKAAETMDRRRRSGDMLWAPQLRELFAFKRNEAIFGTMFAARSLVAGSPEIDRDTVADIIGKSIKDTVTPLRMEG